MATAGFTTAGQVCAAVTRATGATYYIAVQLNIFCSTPNEFFNQCKLRLNALSDQEASIPVEMERRQMKTLFHTG